MQVLILKNLGTRDFAKPYKKGETVSVPKEEGEKLIKRGLAQEVRTIAEPKAQPQIKGIPPKSPTKADRAGTKET